MAVLFFRLAVRKRSIQQQVINNLKAAGQEKRQAHQSDTADQNGRQHGRNGRPHRPCNRSNPSRGGSFIRTHHRHRIGLTSRHIHLRNTEPQQQQANRPIHVWHPRNQDQQHVRRQMGVDHRIDQTDPSRKPTCGQCRDSSQKISEQEDRANHRRVELESNVKPICDNALNDKAPAKRIQSEQER